MSKLKDALEELNGFLTKLWYNDLVRRAFNTFWQAFFAAILLSFATVHDFPTAKAALLAAIAAGLSALKTAYVTRS